MVGLARNTLVYPIFPSCTNATPISHGLSRSGVAVSKSRVMKLRSIFTGLPFILTMRLFSVFCLFS